MAYYEVLVSGQKYHGEGALTYVGPDGLDARRIVVVPLQRRQVVGLLLRAVPKPDFATKPLVSVYNLPPLPAALLNVADWLRQFYPAPLGSVMNLILPPPLTEKDLQDVSALPAYRPSHVEQPPLTAEQQSVLTNIEAPDTYLLHGETGTGKTRVYSELINTALAQGRSALVLTPEIGLTSQLAASLQAVFADRVIVVHSNMTPRERRRGWIQIMRSSAAGRPVIVLGPRSALFSPLNDIGLIVIDEEHEPAYKQEQAPHYQAIRVAAKLAGLHQARLVLGSATPLITDYYMAVEKHKKVLRMTKPAKPSDEKVDITLVDLKDRNQFVRSQYLSTPLLKSIETSLQNNEQSLLYLNRRGTARVILCNACGWQAICPHCDLPLTYHHDQFNLQCHSCGYAEKPPTACPQCGNVDIVFRVVGTKAIESEVARLFPQARLMRFDTDNKKAERFEQHYNDVRAGKVDILVGTQLLAKGLDLPKLSTLGVVVADSSLTFPDYTAEERTYQLLSQVIGRVGRGHLASQRVVVQSYDPARPVIQAAIKRDWDSFYQNEVSERQLFNFPPFSYLLKLSCRRASSSSAEKACEQFMTGLSGRGLAIEAEGPMPSFHARVEGKYEWQIIVRSRQRSALLEVIKLLKTDAKSGWTYDIDPANLL